LDTKGYIIRDFSPGDYPEVDRIWKETGMSDPKRGDDLEVILKTIREGGRLILLEEQSSGILAGTSWVTTDQRRMYLHHFAVRPAFQNRGLSHILLRESLEFAGKNKMQIKLEVHSGNEKAIRLYTDGGFAYLGDYRVYIIRDFP
jgi:ribosomal protein S18 acetylase RimI-like enzyme